MISSILADGFLQMRSQKCYSSYKRQALPARSGQFLRFVIQSARPPADRAVGIVFLLLKADKPDLVIKSIGIEYVLVLCFRKSQF